MAKQFKVCKNFWIFDAWSKKDPKVEVRCALVIVKHHSEEIEEAKLIAEALTAMGTGEWTPKKVEEFLEAEKVQCVLTLGFED